MIPLSEQQASRIAGTLGDRWPHAADLLLQRVGPAPAGATERAVLASEWLAAAAHLEEFQDAERHRIRRALADRSLSPEQALHQQDLAPWAATQRLLQAVTALGADLALAPAGVLVPAVERLAGSPFVGQLSWTALVPALLSLAGEGALTRISGLLLNQKSDPAIETALGQLFQARPGLRRPLSGEGDAFGRAAESAWRTLPPSDREALAPLLDLAASATGSAPKAAWTRTAQRLTAACGSGRPRALLEAWLAALEAPAGDGGRFERHMVLGDEVVYLFVPEAVLSRRSVTVLRGLLWAVAEVEPRPLERAGDAALVRVPEHGARAQSLALAAIARLGRWEGEGQAALEHLAQRHHGKQLQSAIARALGRA